MYDIVFLNVDRIDDNFQSSKESIDELTELVRNIEKIDPECIKYVSLVSREGLEKQVYKVELLKAFLEAHSKARNNIKVGSIFSEDETLYDNNYLVKDKNKESLSDKMYSVIDYTEKELIIIKNVIHITHGIDSGLHEKVKKYNNIVFTDDYESSYGTIDIDNSEGKNFTYLMSVKKDVEGFNDCFFTYFTHRNVVKLTRSNN